MAAVEFALVWALCSRLSRHLHPRSDGDQTMRCSRRLRKQSGDLGDRRLRNEAPCIRARHPDARDARRVPHCFAFGVASLVHRVVPASSPRQSCHRPLTGTGSSSRSVESTTRSRCRRLPSFRDSRFVSNKRPELEVTSATTRTTRSQMSGTKMSLLARWRRLVGLDLPERADASSPRTPERRRAWRSSCPHDDTHNAA